MEILVYRKWFTPRSTIGEITVNGLPQCFSLEDFMREVGQPKVPGKTCIPLGRYHCEITFSPKFGRPLPLLWNVELAGGRRLCVSKDGLISFEGVRFHEGNHADATEGCICVGRQRRTDELLISRPALDDLQAKIQGAQDAKEPVWVTVEAAPPEARMIC